jgi:hypothetical protein
MKLILITHLIKHVFFFVIQLSCHKVDSHVRHYFFHLLVTDTCRNAAENSSFIQLICTLFFMSGGLHFQVAFGAPKCKVCGKTHVFFALKSHLSFECADMLMVVYFFQVIKKCIFKNIILFCMWHFNQVWQFMQVFIRKIVSNNSP